jgi:2-dehydropantoate 2-reductase
LKKKKSMVLHVLGAGSIGLFYAFHYAKRFPNCVLLRRNCKSEVVSVGLQKMDGTMNRASMKQECIGESKTLINNLLLCTKSYDAQSALLSLLDGGRLDRNSNIMILSNGAPKILDEIQNMFSQGTRPNIWVGLTTHGVVRLSRDEIIHTGMGVTALGPAEDSCHSFELMTSLQDSWLELNFNVYDCKSILNRVKTKLAINAAINPLAAIAGCRNGVLCSNAEAKSLMKAICDEISPVLEIDASSLYNSAIEVAELTAENRNSMEVDLSSGRRTEIDYITGYLVYKGLEKELPMSTNIAVLNLIKLKESVNSRANK